MLKYSRKSGTGNMFPNVKIALGTYFTRTVANTDGECTFSVLKRLKY